ncbi:tRNA (adenosine(37)-N6)-dimethylallyltransferase MiaA [Prevotella ihumii]|uniref:tRNA (adenosine(37)-N6)-dimethylallyltransferase MiaA n=1 Tax=Prevotella ihumii TaxID=1917878 RepID=UPI0009824C27|nr:tRNA (adenosine(37)-N6)-dimethylallyltransferase MiaA [Prevotella ihumii]
MKKQTLIVITGPTGVGKTELALRMAEHLSVPIVNADSRQIYAELPIGTAAPTPEQLKRVKHYFVGSHSVTDYYSASMYEQDVLSILAAHPQSNFLLSGGSMMYIDAVCNGIDDIPTIKDEIRTLMMQRYEEEGLEPLCDELRKLDPEYWEIVDRKNHRRVIHALEICHQTGKTYTSFRTNEKKERPFDVIKIGLNREREELYHRINQRTLQMIADGIIEEAKEMYKYRHLNALNTVGYKEMFEYLDGLTTLDETIFKLQSNTRRYARKQLTWFKKDAQMRWFNPDNIEEILNYTTSLLA